MSKSDIATELGLSRFKVSRMIDAARRDGIVRITIAAPSEADMDLSERVARAYGIRQALVVRVAEDREDVIRLQLGRAAAALLAGSLEPDDIVGLSWGRTLQAMSGAFENLPRCTAVQIVGGVPADLSINAMELVRQVAERSGGPTYPLHVPMLLDSPAAAAALRREPQVVRTFEMFEHLDHAVVGIGAWRASGFALEPVLPREIVDRATAAGAVADVCMTLFDQDGNVVDLPELSSRLIAIDALTLRRVPDVIAVAGGTEKAGAVAAALRSGIVHRLVTDETCGRRLLEHL
ncbi:sugar-binding domain-containing protein [Isoptericola sp. b490]|uniref:sugar-binding transcriptional regulator n=1 Tax=Actinotalea lenta TaxID=3064654 RepID=UPI002713898A|nr:sugar-binding domain-containing protein [Isoptericola sp. b490]MDO8119758.1 sugar-binding domain-containing protein [Isoptericola sp. b490]